MQIDLSKAWFWLNGRFNFKEAVDWKSSCWGYILIMNCSNINTEWSALLKAEVCMPLACISITEEYVIVCINSSSVNWTRIWVLPRKKTHGRGVMSLYHSWTGSLELKLFIYLETFILPNKSFLFIQKNRNERLDFSMLTPGKLSGHSNLKLRSGNEMYLPWYFQ